MARTNNTLREPVFNPDRFFAKEGQKGMTMTAADKLANLAKERNREDQSYVDNVQFYTKTVQSLMAPQNTQTPFNGAVLSEGYPGDEETFKKIEECLARIARYNAFITWVREAISAKTALMQAIQSESIVEWCKKNDVLYPENKCFTNQFTVQQELNNHRASLEEDENAMARYYINQAKASVYGQAIHPGGPIDVARRELITSKTKPSTVTGQGQDTIITTMVPTAEPDKVTDFYMKLQGEWRDCESSMNKAKSQWNDADTETELRITAKQNADMKAADALMREAQSKYDTWKLEETKKVSKLKIYIPAALQGVLDELLALGKDKADEVLD